MCELFSESDHTGFQYRRTKTKKCGQTHRQLDNMKTEYPTTNKAGRGSIYRLISGKYRYANIMVLAITN